MKLYTVDYKPYLKLRSIATLIDYGIYFIMLYFYSTSFGTESNGTYTVTGSLALPMLIFWFLYFVVLEAVNQATPGHEIMKLRVFKSEGYKITLTDSFLRRICDPLDFTIYGISAFICISKTPKHQRLGDLLANTVVLKASDVTEREVTFKQ